jgi:hypothetical protein
MFARMGFIPSSSFSSSPVCSPFSQIDALAWLAFLVHCFLAPSHTERAPPWQDG